MKLLIWKCVLYLGHLWAARSNLWNKEAETTGYGPREVLLALFSQIKPGIERVQALADISCLVVCCHSDKTSAAIANLPNSAQLEAPPTIPLSYMRAVQ